MFRCSEPYLRWLGLPGSQFKTDFFLIIDCCRRKYTTPGSAAAAPQQGLRLIEHRHWAFTVCSRPSGEICAKYKSERTGISPFPILPLLAGTRPLFMLQNLDEYNNWEDENQKQLHDWASFLFRGYYPTQYVQ